MDRVDRLRHRRRLAQPKCRPALYQVRAYQRADVVDLLGLQARSVVRRAQHCARDVRAPDWPARLEAFFELAFIQPPAQLAQGRGHPQRALLAVGEKLRQVLAQRGRHVVDRIAEDVQFARRLSPVVDRRDLDRRHNVHAEALACRERL